MLRDQGVAVVECPLIRIAPIAGPPVDLSGYDWVVLTSRHAVEQLLDRLASGLPKAAVIGNGTAAALRKRGHEPAVVATESTQEGLAAAVSLVAGPPGGWRVLFACAEDARNHLADVLRADVLHLYRTVEVTCDLPECDLAVVASPSAARSLARSRFSGPCVSIGPVTTAEAIRSRLTVVAEAETHDAAGLARAVAEAASALGAP
jgi:uroporphyrinogen-III synthase